MRYSSEITSGSLKVTESRVIADLLLQEISGEKWNRAIVDDNVLQTRSRNTALRIGRMLRRRLSSMDASLWALVRDGSKPTATHACLAAAIKSSPLLGDFLDLVVREEYRAFTPALTYLHWENYIEECHNRDPEMSDFTDSTRNRLRSTVFQILAQAGYIENTRTLKLQRVHIDSKVLAYLSAANEKYVLKCIQVSP